MKHRPTLRLNASLSSDYSIMENSAFNDCVDSNHKCTGIAKARSARFFPPHFSTNEINVVTYMYEEEKMKFHSLWTEQFHNLCPCFTVRTLKRIFFSLTIQKEFFDKMRFDILNFISKIFRSNLIFILWLFNVWILQMLCYVPFLNEVFWILASWP